MSKNKKRQESPIGIGPSLAAALWALSLLAGCAGPHQTAARDGLEAPSVSVEPWPGENSSYLVQSAHYRIYTTIDDPEINRRLGQLMEGAFAQYRRLAPIPAVNDKPMECFIFANRDQWARYTERHTGMDSAVYLQIVRGGYTVQERFVAYNLGDTRTDSVAAHEGWHQFAARHFASRLPPFLEEGLACMFESVRWDAGRPRWDWSVNANRAQGLRHAAMTKNLWPLEKLITLHAGQIVDQPRARIDAFYAQNWAFARFLCDADGGGYRPALQRWLADAAAGTIPGASESSSGALTARDPHAVQRMIEHYLGMDLAAIDRAYQRYLRRLADEEE